ncbi:glutathione peroxidase [Belnapia sp. F-4-1]|uniref:glutathione peroxidase n=1 Tax=Belnapia sp. F-4-1 TaxID=1545443 RepID=UPI0005B9227D|nr:glutathione peroxidase [Belnapia sp. F-4-1]
MSGLATGAEPTAFDFRMESLDGGPLDLATFRGRPMLVVNTASFCGFTPQYTGLQKLHDRFSGRGLLVLGVPSNDFNQESADARAIKHFCEANYSVTFPMTVPAHVRGAQAAPLFAFLAAHGGGPPRWNFHKYLVSRDGRRVQGFPSATELDAPALIRAVEAALASTPAA